jgi:hypothetical protein
MALGTIPGPDIAMQNLKEHPHQETQTRELEISLQISTKPFQIKQEK